MVITLIYTATGFRPLSGILFLFLDYGDAIEFIKKMVSVPCRGFYFYSDTSAKKYVTTSGVSVPCRGFYFYSVSIPCRSGDSVSVSVPCRGFYFYSKTGTQLEWREFMKFPSPVGDFIFILKNILLKKFYFVEFPSPVGDFIFILKAIQRLSEDNWLFPSPVGDFIFIQNEKYIVKKILLVSVPCRGFYFYSFKKAL